MNADPAMFLLDMIEKSYSLLYSTRPCEDGTTEFIFRVRIKNARKSALLRRPRTEQFVLCIYAQGDVIKHYGMISDNPTSKAVWSVISQRLGNIGLRSYIDTVFQSVYNHAKKRGVLDIPLHVIQASALECVCF